jgi:hypothetical protein
MLPSLYDFFNGLLDQLRELPRGSGELPRDGGIALLKRYVRGQRL